MVSSRAATLLALGLVAGCEASPRSLDWRIRFATAELHARATVIEARVLAGPCGDAGAEVLYETRFAVGDPVAPAPPRLAPGTYAVEAFGRDASCVVFAGDCADAQLPSGDPVIELILQERPPASACAAGEGCTGGLCDSEREPRDAGPPDAGRMRDAGPIDAPARDAGGADAGRVCTPDATDGTGASCNETSDCADGMFCVDNILGRGRCTRTCASDDDCVPGWQCERPRTCFPSCPDTEICTCGLFGDGDENICDGMDGDCDGRIDEVSSAGVDVCGDGTCNCAVCDCDPGFTACGSRCIDTSSDVRHCGGCDNRCGSGPWTCVGGSCTCTGTMCGTGCVNTNTDESNCGSCGNACGAGYTCSGGSCTCSRTDCDGACVDTMTDETHCGGCATPCAAGESCCMGMCQATAC